MITRKSALTLLKPVCHLVNKLEMEEFKEELEHLETIETDEIASKESDFPEDQKLPARKKSKQTFIKEDLKKKWMVEMQQKIK